VAASLSVRFSVRFSTTNLCVWLSVRQEPPKGQSLLVFPSYPLTDVYHTQENVHLTPRWWPQIRHILLDEMDSFCRAFGEVLSVKNLVGQSGKAIQGMWPVGCYEDKQSSLRTILEYADADKAVVASHTMVLRQLPDN
jgi:hypothetical protein